MLVFMYVYFVYPCMHVLISYVHCVHQILCFSLKCYDFSENSTSSAAELVFDLPLCTLTDIEGKPREARVRNIFENLCKNTIFNEHPVVTTALLQICRYRVFIEYYA